MKFKKKKNARVVSRQSIRYKTMHENLISCVIVTLVGCVSLHLTQINLHTAVCLTLVCCHLDGQDILFVFYLFFSPQVVFVLPQTEFAIKYVVFSSLLALLWFILHFFSGSLCCQASPTSCNMLTLKMSESWFNAIRMEDRDQMYWLEQV